MVAKRDKENMTNEPEYPDCFFCAPCICDDECDCTNGKCWYCGHSVTVKPNQKVINNDK